MNQTQRIPTNLRMLRIAEIVANSDTALTPTEINHELGLPKQTIHRLCTTLQKEGYLVRDGADSRLRPSRRLRSMASGLLHASRFHIARHQILEDVADTVRETVNFVVPNDKGMTYLDRVETNWALRIQLPIGSHVPFHCTASGKTFLASLPKKERPAMVASLALEKRTANTFCNAEELLVELDRVAKQGFAIDNEEFFDNLVAIAVPVRDPEGQYFASIAFHGPVQRLSVQAALAQKHVLLDAAKRLQENLFS
ncbi:MAG: IclR family transcriptional regulator [Pseudomonadota bacterium]